VVPLLACLASGTLSAGEEREEEGDCGGAYAVAGGRQMGRMLSGWGRPRQWRLVSRSRETSTVCRPCIVAASTGGGVLQYVLRQSWPLPVHQPLDASRPHRNSDEGGDLCR